ncbi:hypothetical protein GQX74_001291 [Glossina fuscipes]|nr:hypothetical protein GQX74_001291 [Glossina fuscipes]
MIERGCLVTRNIISHVEKGSIHKETKNIAPKQRPENLVNISRTRLGHKDLNSIYLKMVDRFGIALVSEHQLALMIWNISEWQLSAMKMSDTMVVENLGLFIMIPSTICLDSPIALKRREQGRLRHEEEAKLRHPPPSLSSDERWHDIQGRVMASRAASEMVNPQIDAKCDRLGDFSTDSPGNLPKRSASGTERTLVDPSVAQQLSLHIRKRPNWPAGKSTSLHFTNFPSLSISHRRLAEKRLKQSSMVAIISSDFSLGISQMHISAAISSTACKAVSIMLLAVFAFSRKRGKGHIQVLFNGKSTCFLYGLGPTAPVEPCKARNPCSGTRDEPVTNCKRRARISEEYASTT